MSIPKQIGSSEVMEIISTHLDAENVQITIEGPGFLGVANSWGVYLYDAESGTYIVGGGYSLSEALLALITLAKWNRIPEFSKEEVTVDGTGAVVRTYEVDEAQ